MSESLESAAPSGDTSDDFGEAVKNLGIEGLAPDTDNTSDAMQATDPDDLPEGIPAKDTLKVNGKEVERTYSEIKAAAQKYEATSMKLEQAKKEVAQARDLQQQVQGQQQAVRNLLEVVKRGDIETIDNFSREYLGAGDGFQRAVIEYALRLYEYSKMAPEQRELLEHRKTIEKMQRDAQQRAQQDQYRAMEYEVNRWSEHIEAEIPKALKQVGLPDTNFVREHVIATWRAAIEAGRNPTAAAVSAFVKKRLEESRMMPNAASEKPAPRRATRESVGLKTNGEDQSGYQSWSEWQKSRRGH